MISLLISIIIVLCILGLAYWAINMLAGAFGLPAPIVTVLNVILVVIAVIYLLSLLGGYPVPRLR